MFIFLGFLVYLEKLVLVLIWKFKFLGFIFDFECMIVLLIFERVGVIKEVVKRLLVKLNFIIWDFVEVIGKFVVVF